jgi:diguanylate cyclase (GGDEF)-like protein
MMKKNTFTLIIILIGLIGLFLFYNIAAVREEALEVAEVSLAKEANHVSAEFSTWIRGEVRMLETLKDIIENLPAEQIKTPNQYNEILNMSEEYTAPYIGFEDGTVLIGDRHNLLDNYDPRERVWYKKAIEENKTTISEVYLGAEYGRPMITISTPFYMKGELAGVLGADMLISELIVELEANLEIPHSYIYIMTEEGFILLHTKHENWIGQSVQHLSLENKEVILNEILSSSEERISYGLEGTSVIAVIRRMKDMNWIVGVAIDESYVHKEVGAYLRGTTIINFLFFIVMLFIVRNLYNLEKAVFATNAKLREKVYELHRAYDQIDAINQQLEEKSQTDALTGIGNRGYFDQSLDQHWLRSLRESKSINLIIFDVDYFKSFNDHYGHAIGDQALVEIAHIVANFLDEEVIFARVGGEEFAILGYNQELGEILRLAEALRQSIEDCSIPHERSNHGVVTVSMGVHRVIASEGITMGDFYHEADKAMYKSKQTGRNKVTLYKA